MHDADATGVCCLTADVIVICVVYLATIVSIGLVAQKAFDYIFLY